MFLVWFPGYLVPDPGWMRWGGRPPYGYQLADAGPHPNKAHAAWGRRAHRLEPDPETAPQVAWIFANDCPGTAWPGSPARSTRPGSRARRLPTRSATRIAAAELGRCTQSARSWPIPRYTGRQVWNRQRTDSDLVDPANTGLGHRAVQRWNRPEGWVISTRPAHPAILSETDYIAAQDLSLRRGPDSPAARCYRLAGLLRRESADGSWSPAGPTAKRPTGADTATPAPPAQAPPGRKTPTSAKPRSCPASPPWPSSCAARSRPTAARRRTTHTAPVPAAAADVIAYLRTSSITLTYDPHQRTLRASTHDTAAITIDQKPPGKAGRS